LRDQEQTTKPQRDRFIEKARELGCDEDEAQINESLKWVARTNPVAEQPARQNADDLGNEA